MNVINGWWQKRLKNFMLTALYFFKDILKITIAIIVRNKCHPTFYHTYNINVINLFLMTYFFKNYNLYQNNTKLSTILYKFCHPTIFIISTQIKNILKILLKLWKLLVTETISIKSCWALYFCSVEIIFLKKNVIKKILIMLIS